MKLEKREAKVVATPGHVECVFCGSRFTGDGVPMRTWGNRQFHDTWAGVPCARKGGSGCSLIHLAR